MPRSTPVEAVVPRMRGMECHQKGARWEVDRPPADRGRPLH